MAYLKNNYAGYIDSEISASQGVGSQFRITNDIESGQPFDSGDGQGGFIEIDLVIRSETQIERMKVTANQGLITIVKRGVTQNNDDGVDTRLQKKWNVGTICYSTLFSSFFTRALGFGNVRVNGESITPNQTGDTININTGYGVRANVNSSAREVTFAINPGTLDNMVTDATQGPSVRYPGRWELLENQLKTINGKGLVGNGDIILNLDFETSFIQVPASVSTSNYVAQNFYRDNIGVNATQSFSNCNFGDIIYFKSKSNPSPVETLQFNISGIFGTITKTIDIGATEFLVIVVVANSNNRLFTNVIYG